MQHWLAQIPLPNILPAIIPSHLPTYYTIDDKTFIFHVLHMLQIPAIWGTNITGEKHN